MAATPGSLATEEPPRAAEGSGAAWLSRILCWAALVGSAALALVSLSTAVLVPQWIDWEVRLIVTGLSGEIGYRYLPVPIAMAALSLLLRKRHRIVATAAFAFSVLAVVLLAKPAGQAWWLGRTLPDQLAGAFGPSAGDRAPFSLRTLYGPLPEEVTFMDGTYDGKHRFEFMRAMGRSPAPCVILLHGGGWFGTGFQDRRPMSFWLARRGYAVVSMAYSSLPDGRWPEPRDDVLHAIAALRAHATGLGIDANRLVLLGRSAGAQIALATAYAAHDPGIRGVVDLYGPADLREAWRLAQGSAMRLHGMTARQILETFFGGTPADAGAHYDSASAVTLVGSDTPPTLILHGALDSTLSISQSRELAAKLNASGRPCLLIVIPWASHAFDTLNFNGPGSQVTTYSVERFLAAVTR